MTYKEAYSNARTLDELKQMAIKDAKFIFITEDRVKAIEKAMNEVADEKGWTDLENKRDICAEYRKIKETAHSSYGYWPEELERSIDILLAFGWEWGHPIKAEDLRITKGYYLSNYATEHRPDDNLYYVHWDNHNIGRLQFVTSDMWGDVEEEWQEFKDRLMSYDPVNYDPLNSHIVYDVENGKKLWRDYQGILLEFRKIFKQKCQKIEIERKQKELEKLMQEVEE